MIVVKVFGLVEIVEQSYHYADLSDFLQENKLIYMISSKFGRCDYQQ